jgi:Tol biopolymer transport system component
MFLCPAARLPASFTEGVVQDMGRLTLVVAVALAVGPGLVHGDTKKARPVLIVSSCTGNSDVFLVDAASGDAKNLSNHPSADGFPAWSADGKHVAFSSDRDGGTNLFVIDADGRNLRQLTHEKAGAKVGCIMPTWSPDGSTIAFARVDGDKREVCVIASNGGEAEVLAEDGLEPAWSPDGQAIAFASRNGKEGWRLAIMRADGSRRHNLVESDNPNGCTSPAWSPDGSLIAYADRAPGATEIFLIDRTGKHRRQLTFCCNLNSYPAWSPDGESITFMHAEAGGSGFLTINADGTGLRTDNVAGTDHPAGPGWRIAYQPSADRRPKVAEVETSPVRVVALERDQVDLPFRILQRLPGHAAGIKYVGFAPEGRHMVTAGLDGAVVHWNWTNQGFRPEQPLVGPKGAVMAGCWSPDGANFAAAYGDGSVKIWDVDHHSDWLTVEDLAGKVGAIAWSPDGKLLAVACQGRKVQIHRASTGKLVKKFDVPGTAKQEITALVFTADSTKLLAAGGDPSEKHDSGMVSSWDVKSGKQEWCVSKLCGGALCMALSPDGKSVAVGARDGVVHVRDAGSGAARGTLEGHKEGVLGVSWSPDGARVASASLDHTVRVWDAAACRQRALLTGHLAPALGVTFSRDGRVIASSGLDRLVCVWHLED